MTITNTACKT